MRTPRTTLRTFGVIAHADAGSTTLSERLLFVTGRLQSGHERPVQAGTVVLEPIMRVEVATTGEHTGAVSGLLAARRGVLTGVETRTAGRAYVTAEVPLAELAEGFIATLRSATSGRAEPGMHLLGYRPAG